MKDDERSAKSAQPAKSEKRKKDAATEKSGVLLAFCGVKPR